MNPWPRREFGSIWLGWLLVAAFLCAILSPNSAEGLLDTSRALSQRRKRAYLVYQPGLNWVQLVMGIGLPLEVDDNSITMGAVVKSYYELPNNVSQYTNPSIDIERRRSRRAAMTMPPSRWEIYDALQSVIRSLGFADGKACLLNAICEASQHRFDANGGLLAELLHLLLTPSATPESIANAMDRDFHAAEAVGKRTTDCQVLYSCEANLLQKFTHVPVS